MRPRNSALRADEAMGVPRTVSWLNGEVHALGDFADDAALEGARAEIVDRDRVETLHDLLLQVAPHRADHALAELGGGERFLLFLGRFQRAHHPDDLADRNAPPLARQPIAAARA